MSLKVWLDTVGFPTLTPPTLASRKSRLKNILQLVEDLFLRNQTKSQTKRNIRNKMLIFSILILNFINWTLCWCHAAWRTNIKMTKLIKLKSIKWKFLCYHYKYVHGIYFDFDFYPAAPLYSSLMIAELCCIHFGFLELRSKWTGLSQFSLRNTQIPPYPHCRVSFDSNLQEN